MYIDHTTDLQRKIGVIPLKYIKSISNAYVRPFSSVDVNCQEYVV